MPPSAIARATTAKITVVVVTKPPPSFPSWSLLEDTADSSSPPTAPLTRSGNLCRKAMGAELTSSELRNARLISSDASKQPRRAGPSAGRW
eukprot:scaffold7205_cov149-Isochrysis_galbana.AAC.2